MLPALLLLAALLPGTALAQSRSFNCVGADQLEDDVFAIPFARGAAAPGETARTNLAAAADRAKREPERAICVLGHAGPQEGGAQSGIQLAARRAGQVAAALAKLGIAPDRIRAEARRAAFARGAVPEERSVTVVLLPATPGLAPEARPEAPAHAPEPPARPAGEALPKPPPEPAPPPASAPPADAPPADAPPAGAEPPAAKP
ncbi:OmpA family protein [Roseicella frigidaeris]|uniref:OmpA-like domain-containing protein n=1 Tax=Roseicella frigidaeris TaxID=2230885 RepID=A0A327MEJ2_9PROT|nr:OmpA family protein [Roseicella frigidaeris]RAI60955.1 hypothetical protein DOO78_02140 [Roseicella frigidaeris]